MAYGTKGGVCERTQGSDCGAFDRGISGKMQRTVLQQGPICAARYKGPDLTIHKLRDHKVGTPRLCECSLGGDDGE